MFTGIVEEVGTVVAVGPAGLTISAAKVMGELVEGASVSVNGVCLTVTSRDETHFAVDVVPETLRRTNLGSLQVGGHVNLERPVPVSGRLDGHIVQGHVDGTGTIESVDSEAEALMVAIGAPPTIMRYVVEKGFIAVDGTSLTVVNCDPDRFTITVIPYTRDNTILGNLGQGDVVNLEIDILSKYVERLQVGARTNTESQA